MKAQRLSLMGVQMKKLIHLEMPQYFIYLVYIILGIIQSRYYLSRC
nr:MAG TPA: hypothetical protein [Crassvirales sp.]